MATKSNPPTDAQVKEALKECEELTASREDLCREELVALILLLSNDAGFRATTLAIGIKGKDRGVYEYDHKLLKTHSALQEKTIEDLQSILNYLVRNAILNVFASTGDDRPEESGKAAAMRALAMRYIPEKVKLFDAVQQEKAEKRQANLQKKIDALKTSA